jgi:hypothetical protein
MRILIPLLLISVFLIPLVQSSYAQESGLQSLFSTIIPKIQNFTHTLNAKMQNLKNNASSEFNNGDSGINQGLNKTKPFLGQLYNRIIPNTY